MENYCNRSTVEAPNLKNGPLPQGDGADRPFVVHDLGTLPGPRVVHLEKSGPAFYCPAEPPIKQQLEQSLQAQAVRITAEALMALRRCVLLDVCATWPRLLTLVGVTSLGARRQPRESWAWQEMREAVEIALVYAEYPRSIH